MDRLQEVITNKKIKGAITKEVLVNNGMKYKNDLIKILGRGELTSKINITVDAYSFRQRLLLKKAGGTANVITTTVTE